MLELTLIVSKHVSQTIDEGLVHLDCRVVYQIADIVQEALTFICKVQARLSGELPTIECALGWVQFNRYCRVRHPKGLSGHHGPAALSFLRLLSVARNSVKQLFPPNHPLEEVRPIDIPAFRIDLSWLIIDRESDCYSGLRAIFNSLVAITTFVPLFEPELDTIVPFYVAIALPASIIDGLLNGPAPSIPTPLGQLNPCYSIDSCLRKLSRWYHQDCFFSCTGQGASEDCRLQTIVYTSNKRNDGYGGYANFHNCAFIGFSWCGIANSDSSPDGGHSWRLPAPCRNTAIVLSLPLNVEELASLTHGSSYRGYHPIEAYNRHCNFPIALQDLQGLPPLTLHSDNGKEIPLNEERKIAKSSQQLSQNEQDILIAAASVIAKKRKDISD